jgi:hypothetical protein
LLSGFAASRKPVDEALVHEVTRDFALETRTAGPAPRTGEEMVASAESKLPVQPTRARAPVSNAPSTHETPIEPAAAVGGETRAPMFSQVTRRRRFIFF